MPLSYEELEALRADSHAYRASNHGNLAELNRKHSKRRIAMLIAMLLVAAFALLAANAEHWKALFPFPAN
jgi:hypothetical protein